MDSPVLELKIISANDLKRSSLFSSSLQPYVLVSISGANFPSYKTPVDPVDGRNPTWNHPLTFSLPGGLTTAGNLTLRLEILSRRVLTADKLVGEVYVPLADLFQHTPAAGDSKAAAKFVSYQVKRQSGRSKGVLTFSYRLTGSSPVATTGEDPLMAYPAKPEGVNYPVVDSYKYDAYRPPVAPVTSYGYPTQAECGSYGYGYPGQLVQPNRKTNNGLGLGLGAGLLGGAVAGLVVGDLVSDSAFDFGGGDGFF